ncbi:MAG: glycosyltransferase [Syntrophomonadaceae bacterium]|jgi:glycosyltransferase involved in cell wall biosynthesis
MKEKSGKTKTNISYETGVSVITCTNRPLFINYVFDNYERQLHNQKELIIILNNNDIDRNAVIKQAANYEAVKVYQLDESLSLGACYNFAVQQCQYEYIAKFDDDDYYAPLHLSESIRAFTYTQADIVGKHTRFIYFENSNWLMLYEGINYNYGIYVVGATMVFKRNVWDMVNFSNLTVGEDSDFQEKCLNQGFKIFATDEYNYVTIRRKDINSHTFKLDEATYMAFCNPIAKTVDYVPLITRRYHF